MNLLIAIFLTLAYFQPATKARKHHAMHKNESEEELDDSEVDLCVCDSIFNPVCGTDKKTYPSKCELMCESLENIRNGFPPIYVRYHGACEENVDCSCSSHVALICGSDGLTYTNPCALACENRKLQQLKLPLTGIVKKGSCPSPSCICSQVVSPVCGSNGLTYRNVCFLQCASRRNQARKLLPISMQHQGGCEKEDCVCTTKFKPVCASDHKIYRNRCLFDCKNRRRLAFGLHPLTIKFPGVCP